ncbi:hypothetical protein ACWDR0_07075 [Streptomyces sp. NPDC003691]
MAAIAAGHLREVEDGTALDSGGVAEYWTLDQDERSLATVAAVCGHHGWGFICVHTQSGKENHSTNREQLPRNPFGLVIGEQLSADAKEVLPVRTRAVRQHRVQAADTGPLQRG